MTKSNTYSNPKMFWEKRLQKNFDLIGSGYAALGPIYNSRIYQARLAALERAIKSSHLHFSGEKILEIGCGTGFFTNYCKEQQVQSYTGIDITDVSINTLAEKYPGFRFLQGDIGDDEFFISEKFDIILAADVLYHIVDDGRFATAIHHIGNSLQLNGHVIISDWFTNSTVDTHLNCKMRSNAIYKDLLIKNGLIISHIEPVFSILNPPAFTPHSSVIWRIYSIMWRYVIIRVARFGWFDKYISRLVLYLENKYFLHHASINTPNTKWLIAVKSNVG